MNLDQLYRVVNYISAKVVSGNTLTPDNYNDLLPTVQDIITNDELKKLVQDELSPVPDELLSLSPLRPFRFMDTLIVGSSGFTSAPNDYIRWSSMLNSRNAPITVVSDHTAAIRQGNVFGRSDIKNFCYIVGGAFRFIPYDIGTIYLNYIRKPLVPYFDWCLDANYNVVFMPYQSYITAVGAIQVLYDVNDVVLASDVTKADMNYLPFPSRTVELEWEERYAPIFIGQLLKLVGINLKENDLTQLMAEYSKE